MSSADLKFSLISLLRLLLHLSEARMSPSTAWVPLSIRQNTFHGHTKQCNIIVPYILLLIFSDFRPEDKYSGPNILWFFSYVWQFPSLRLASICFLYWSWFVCVCVYLCMLCVCVCVYLCMLCVCVCVGGVYICVCVWYMCVWCVCLCGLYVCVCGVYVFVCVCGWFGLFVLILLSTITYHTFPSLLQTVQ